MLVNVRVGDTTGWYSVSGCELYQGKLSEQNEYSSLTRHEYGKFIVMHHTTHINHNCTYFLSDKENFDVIMIWTEPDVNKHACACSNLVTQKHLNNQRRFQHKGSKDRHSKAIACKLRLGCRFSDIKQQIHTLVVEKSFNESSLPAALMQTPPCWQLPWSTTRRTCSIYISGYPQRGVLAGFPPAAHLAAPAQVSEHSQSLPELRAAKE